MDDAQLINRIKEAALLHGTFTLRSGRTSNYYLDKYLFETDPVILVELGRRFAARIGGIPGGVDRLAGAELGGIPLVTATSLTTGLPTLLVRNQKKGYGTAQQVEGRFQPGERVAIIEDVVTTGGQTLEAARQLESLDLRVLRILIVIDREEGARENIEGAGFQMEALLTKHDLGIEE